MKINTYYKQYLISKLKPLLKTLLNDELDILIECAMDERLTRTLKKKGGDKV